MTRPCRRVHFRSPPLHPCGPSAVTAPIGLERGRFTGSGRDPAKKVEPGDRIGWDPQAKGASHARVRPSDRGRRARIPERMEAIVLREHGGPDVLRLEQLDVPGPGRGQARVKVAASGVNYFDIRQRTGDFKTALPVVLGNEGAGTVDAIGPGVSDVHVGDRVGWEMEQGSYATHALIAAGGTILVHGVAGGVGGFLCEIAHLRGGRVIGTVTRADKAAAARAIGA